MANIQKNHMDRIEQLRSEITATFDARLTHTLGIDCNVALPDILANKSDSLKSYRDQLIALSSLVKRRSIIQSDIIKSTKKLECAFIAVNKELEAVLNARIDYARQQNFGPNNLNA